MTSTKKHILFIVPDGVGIKNFLYSDIIKILKSECEITIWSTLPLEAFKDVERIHKLKFNYKNIILRPESVRTRLYREATTYARLIHNSKLKKNITILTNWRRPKSGLKIKVLYKLAEYLGTYLSKNYTNILRFEEKSKKYISQQLIEFYINQLRKVQPTTIFITHQRVPGIMPICIAAKKLNIKTSTAIFSWDNLPKARLAVDTDQYLVWSKWMKDEMKDYYPEIPENNVKLVGTPQFEFYLDKNRIISRNDFAKKYGLNSEKVWICFSGDDVTTSPHDNLYLRDVAEELYKEKDNLQILFRRCPVDFSNRYDDILEEFNDLIVSIDPIWNIEAQTGWVGFFPKYDDINMQVNISYHCNIVINLGSTMALDFAVYNKPCLYLDYNPSNKTGWTSKITYGYQHFRSMKNYDAVGWIKGKNEILIMIQKGIKNPESIAADRKLWMKDLVLHPLNENSNRISKQLL